ncbi:MAG: peptide chain release factor N(5)-glutamine methyltransferase [Cyanobacteria bacterium]|nr:peptide chain release factor N(5)-glutamine methyltransferase [Cyanobacteriota bacterium]
MNLRDKINSARARLVAAGIEHGEAGRDANLLARHVLGWDRSMVYAHETEEVTPDFVARYDPLIERRARREPAAYIRGVQEFWSRDFAVTPKVLIPRPETELIVEELFARLPEDLPNRRQHVADIGTGSGCIAVTVAAERPYVEVIATDISEDALRIAQQNAGRHGVSDRIAFREAAYLTGSTEKFDFILANPPYVTERDYQNLAPEVREYEPAIALVSGEDGFRDIRQIVDLATAYLTPGGTLLMEIGYDQADAVADLVASYPALKLAGISNDLQNIPRVAIIERKIVA